MNRIGIFGVTAALMLAAGSPALARTTVYPASICKPGNPTTAVTIPYSSGGLRFATNGVLICPIPKTGTTPGHVQNVWIRVRRGGYFGPIMLTLWSFDSMGNLVDSSQSRINQDDRNTIRSYRLPIGSAGVRGATVGYYLVNVAMNQGDELVSIRVDDSE